MVAFIKQRKLKDKTEKNIPQITKFDFTAWKFLTAIYESDWDKLPANWNKTTFRQCISVQSNKTMSKFPKIFGLKPKEKEKEANILRIFPPIPPQLSRNILEKSKFFKIN